MLRFLTAGESHGPAEVAILEGIPADLPISETDIQTDLDKRRGGSGRGGRGIIEKDQIKILSGVRFGKTIGSPIALMIENSDWSNWKEKMSIGPVQNEAISAVTNPRPGHADLAGILKYGFKDIRNVLERASARETVMRVAVGAVCRKLLNQFGVEIASHTVQIGMISIKGKIRKTQEKSLFERVKNVLVTDPEIRCIDKIISVKMKEAILKATLTKNTLGGIVEVIAHNVPPGLGSYVHFDRKIDGRLAGSLMSIPSVKAVEIGEGISNAANFGSEAHDEIIFKNKKFGRNTNHAGGIEGGVTNGQNLILRVYHKPVSTLGNPLRSADIKSKIGVKALIERSDICVVPRAGVISEAMTAFVLAGAFIEKFGGDSLSEIKYNFKGFQNNLATI